jgi:carboxyl-terminal processing protease
MTMLACVVCIAVTAAVCLLFFRGDDYKKYEEIRSVIQEYYVGNADEAAIEDAVSRAIVQSLGDRWSYYMSQEEYGEYQLYSTNRYTGIGISAELDEESHYPVIVSVSEDSPAARAGLETGYSLLALEGSDLKDKTSAELRELMESYGEENFTLTVMNAQEATRDVELKCELVFSEPVRYEMLSGDIGYVRIINFEEGCAAGMESAVDDLIAQGAVSLIFDVRDNPGGKVSELIDALDYLLPKGDLFISRSKDGTEKTYDSDADSVALPMAVIINGNSYSAAEFFAAVLREYEVAVLVGEPTTGKGRSQTTVELSDGSAVHISNNVYLTPGEKDLSETGGVVPDVEASPVEDGELDVPLQAAKNALS